MQMSVHLNALSSGNQRAEAFSYGKQAQGALNVKQVYHGQ